MRKSYHDYYLLSNENKMNTIHQTNQVASHAS